MDHIIADLGIRNDSTKKGNALVSPAQMAGSTSSLLADAEIAGRLVFIHVDYDVLDPVTHPHTAFPEPEGIDLETLIAWLSDIRRRANVVGFGLTEYAPAGTYGTSDDVARILHEGFGMGLR